MTRRSLISRLALATSPVLAASSQPEPHTLIHVFLRGGADTLNFFVPHADDRYYRLRPGLAIPKADALRISDHYSLHPALKPLEALYKEGRFGAVQSVGLDNTSGSHFECQDQMEHGDSMHGTPAGGGWLGRFLRSQATQEASSLAAVAIGTVLPESLRGAPAVSVLERIDDIAIKAAKNDDSTKIVEALKKLYGSEVTLLGQRGMATLDLFQRIAALQGPSDPAEHGANYPPDRFGLGLREIARLIKARLGLQVACIDLGGWDTHFFQGTSSGLLAERIKTLAEGLLALTLDLSAHRHNYTVMITTEFGRRVYENASLGTDHGRGFALMALGERVHGGQVLGKWPIPLEDDVTLATLGPGGIQPETDYRLVFAEVLRACFNAQNLERLFPNIDLKPVGLL